MIAAEWQDTVTILKARDNRRLAKTVSRDGAIADYDSAYLYDADTQPVASVLDIMALLGSLISKPTCCVVRGELASGTHAIGIRRLVHGDTESGNAPTLRDVPRRWLALDADGIARPKHVPAADLLACADEVMQHLPRAFGQAACIVQATAGHGIKPGCRLRLWFYCDRPMSGAELKRWLGGFPFDASVYRAVQPIYSAAPIFLDGRTDHLPARLVEYPGEDWLRCPTAEGLAPPPAKPISPPDKIAFGTNADAYARAALIGAADAILRAGVGNRHGTIISESRSLARLVKAGMLSERDLRAVVARAAEHVGKSDAAEVASMIGWALANPSHATLPEVRHAA